MSAEFSDVHGVGIQIYFFKNTTMHLQRRLGSGFKVQAESFQGTDRTAFCNRDTVQPHYMGLQTDLFNFFSRSNSTLLGHALDRQLEAFKT